LATKAYTAREISLQDDTEVTVRPLPIGRLRRFLEAWEAIKGLEDGDDGFGVFINCSGIALEHEFKGKGKFDSVRAPVNEDGEFLSAEYKEYLEDVLDLETIYVILEVAGGIKLNDPKLMEAALAATQE
jgi:hypothetical protein